MKAKLVKESLLESSLVVAEFPIEDLCSNKITWEEIKPYVEKGGNRMKDPGFYSDKKVRNEEEYNAYIEQFEKRFGCEGVMQFDKWDFWRVEGNPRYSAALSKTADEVGYGKGRYMGD